MVYDIRTHELISQTVGPDGTLINEYRERETPLELPHHDTFHDEQWKAVKSQRDALLKETDWMASRAFETGIPMSQEWLDYRQALRDLTEQQNPFLLVWPEKPASGQKTAPVIVYDVEERDV